MSFGIQCHPSGCNKALEIFVFEDFFAQDPSLSSSWTFSFISWQNLWFFEYLQRFSKMFQNPKEPSSLSSVYFPNLKILCLWLIFNPSTLAIFVPNPNRNFDQKSINTVNVWKDIHCFENKCDWLNDLQKRKLKVGFAINISVWTCEITFQTELLGRNLTISE